MTRPRLFLLFLALVALGTAGLGLAGIPLYYAVIGTLIGIAAVAFGLSLVMHVVTAR